MILCKWLDMTIVGASNTLHILRIGMGAATAVYVKIAVVLLLNSILALGLDYCSIQHCSNKIVVDCQLRVMSPERRFNLANRKCLWAGQRNAVTCPVCSASNPHLTIY